MSVHARQHIVFVALLLVSFNSAAQTLKANLWVTNGSVHALAKSSRTLYVGGNFTYVGPATGTGVLLNATTGVYDQSWPRFNGEILAVAADGNGGFYVGGEFTSAGGFPRNRIAHIRSDHVIDAWDPNADGRVTALAVYGTNVYAGGDFANIGGQPRSRIAALRMTTGLASPWNPVADGGVYAFSPVSNLMYIGGSFLTIGGQQRASIAAIDTGSNTATSFNPVTDGAVYALAAGANGLYLGGTFTNVNGRTRNNLALVSYAGIVQGYDPSPSGAVRVLQLAGSKLYLGGDFLIVAGVNRNHVASLDALTPLASAWNPNADGPVLSILLAGATVYLGGTFASIGSVTRNNIARVDTSGVLAGWNPNADATVNVLAGIGGSIFAGGVFSSVNGVQRNNLAALDDSSGIATAWNPDAAGGTVDVLALSGQTIYAGGTFTSIGGQGHPNVAAINVITGVPAPWSPNLNGGVSGLAVSGGRIYVAGSFTTAGSLLRNRIAAIDSASAVATGWNPNSSANVLVVAVSGSTVYAGGQFSTIGGQSRNRLAALDIVSGNATAWNPNGASGPNDAVAALSVTHTTIYAGGNFQALGGQTRNSLAALDSVTGTATTFDAHLNSTSAVNALEVTAGNLYVGGTFNPTAHLLPVSTSDLISVNSSTGVLNNWDPLVKQGVNAIAITDSTVYAGGQFTTVLNDTRPNLAAVVDPSLSLPAFHVDSVALHFGNVPVGQSKTDTLLVNNTGAGTLDIGLVASNNALYTVAPSSNISIPPGRTQMFFITFHPNITGMENATITFTHNAPGSPSLVAVGGTGVAPEFTVVPASLGFGPVRIDSSKTDTILVTNTGTAILNVSSVVSSNGRFTVVPAAATINPSSQRIFLVTFSPLTPGNVGGIVTFTHDAPGSPSHVTVAGTGVTPSFTVAPAAVAFGNVIVNTYKADSVRVSNTGTSDLVIDSVYSTDHQFIVAPASATIPESSAIHFRIAFTPAANGLKTANIIFHHNASGSPDTVTASGTGVTASFSVAPTSLDFGNVVVDSSRRDSLTVTNSGSAVLNISAVQTSDERFTINPVSASISPSGSKKFFVTFLPDIPGIINASITFVHDAVGSPTSIDVRGAGVVPVISVTPPSLNFGNVKVGTNKQDTVTVSNTGLATLHITNVSSSSGRFTVIPANATVAPSGRARFAITFAPDSAGPANGNIVFTHDASGSPTVVPVLGRGVVPLFSVVPSVKNFGNVVISSTAFDSVNVTNAGGASLLIFSVVSSNSQFTVVPTNATVPANSNRWFFIAFAPDSTGLKTADITFSHDAAGSPDTVIASGFGITSTFSVEPSGISFGNVHVGGSKQDSVTVSNSGTSAIIISSVVPGNSQISVAPSSATVPAGGSRTFIVTFTPAISGSVNSSITFTHNAVGSPTSIAVNGVGIAPAFLISRQSIAFDRVRVGTTKSDTVSVSNPGTDSLSITSVSVSDPRFGITPGNATLAPSARKTFVVTFTPGVRGNFNGTILFTHNGISSPGALIVSGSGIAPVVVASPRNVSFGDVGVGSPANTTVHIINAGDTELNIDSLRIRGRDAPVFAIMGSRGPFAPVVAGDSLAVTIRFSPAIPDSTMSAFLIVNSDASSNPDTLNLQGRGRHSLVQVTLGGDTLAGGTISLQAVPPQGFIADRAVLFYRAGGRRRYDSLACQQSGQTFSARFPDSVVTIRGIEYYLSMQNTDGHITNPENDPVNNPAIVQVRVARAVTSVQLVRRKYKMISIPLELNDTRASAQLVDDFGSYNPVRWRLFRWENERNVEFDSIRAQFTPSTSFWLITQTGQTFDAKNGRSVPSGVAYPIDLLPGWNQIASPFAFDVAWDGIGNSQLVHRPVYWDGLQFVPDAQVLQPWEGYFVLNDSAGVITLSVPSVEASSTMAKYGGQMTAGNPNDYILQFSASVAGSDQKDEYNFVGFREHASSGRDLLDVPEPPAIENSLQLSFIEGGEAYLASMKPYSDDGQAWQMRIGPGQAGQTIHVVLTPSGRLPADFKIYILDEDQFAIVPVEQNAFSLQMKSANEIRSFKVIIGTKSFAERSSNGIPLVPLVFSLGQNFPNPFNPSTTIRYTLSKRSDVVLEVFNVLGQLVRTLVRGDQVTGAYATTWDGTNANGQIAASGVYVYRLRAGEFVSSRKLLLLR